MPQSRIRMFWDLASCPPPPDCVSPAEILQDVRQFTSNFGVVNSIKAYWDRNKARQLNDSLYAAMPSIGVNLIDCSSLPGYSDDALTKMLIVDTLISAMDDPGSNEKDILMIISGDESVLYPISLLMFRNYTVFLVVPDENDTQSFRATRVFRWYQDVLCCQSNLNPEQPTSTLGLMSPPQHSLASGQYFPPSRRPVPSAVNAITPRSKENISLPSSRYPTPSVLSPQVSGVRNLGNDHTEEIPATPKSSAPSRHSEIKPSQVPQPIPQPIPEESVERTEEDDWGATSGWTTSGNWTMAGTDWDTDPVPPAPKPEVKLKKPEREPKSEPKPKPTQPPVKKSQSGSSAPSLAPAQASNPIKKPQSSASNPAFDPLLQILREAENQSMKRSQLGEHLAKRKGLYGLIGANGFGEYIALAVKHNLVVIRGIDKHQSVELRKKV